MTFSENKLHKIESILKEDEKPKIECCVALLLDDGRIEFDGKISDTREEFDEYVNENIPDTNNPYGGPKVILLD